MVERKITHAALFSEIAQITVNAGGVETGPCMCGTFQSFQLMYNARTMCSF